MLIKNNTKEKITSSGDVAQICNSILNAEHVTDQGKEHWWVIGLNTQNQISYVELVGLGLSSSCPVAPKETFRLAIMKNVDSIICVHNHPSGCVEPSTEDHKVTTLIKKAGKILLIPLLDHIIIGDNGAYYSFSDTGNL